MRTIIQYNLTYHNKLPNFFRKGKKSCIDFMISNCPTKFLNIRTHYEDNIFQYDNTNYSNILSNHVMVSGIYNKFFFANFRQFRIMRNFKLLTKYTLNQYFSLNKELNSIFNYSDPDIIAEILIR